MSHASMMKVNEYYSQTAHYPLNELAEGDIVVKQSDKRIPRPGSTVLFCGTFEDRCIISAWTELIPELEKLASDISLSRHFLEQDIRSEMLDLCIGKTGSEAVCYTYKGVALYCGRDMRQPVQSGNIRPITRENAGRVISDLLDDGIPTGLDYLFCDNAAYAYFSGERAVSYAATHPVGDFSDRIGHLMVGTHRDFRGRGYGKSVVSATTGKIVEQGRVAVYGTMEDNIPSIKTAQSVGYQIYCHRFEVRLAY